MSLVGAEMGILLNDDPIKELPIERKLEVKKLLARYIANSNTFSKMLELNMCSIFITSLMSVDKNNKRGYSTRIAGVMKDHISTAILIHPDSNDKLMDALGNYDIGYTVLLKLLSTNSSYNNDKYDAESLYHSMKSQFITVENMEIKSQAHPSNN
jgi:hypothetical protein